MKNLITLILAINSTILLAQLPETNLIFRLDYEGSFEINFGETAYYDYQSGFLTEDRYNLEDNSCSFEADKQIIKFNEFPCIEEELTISLWIKYNSFQGERYPIMMLSNNDELNFNETKHIGFEVHNDKTSLGYYNENGGRIIYDQDSISYDNEWHHLLGTISDLSLMKMYVDNEYLGYQEFNIETFEDINQIIIGGGYDGLFGHMKIDDIRLYNRSLERCEIEALFYEKDMEIDCGEIEEKECNGIVNIVQPIESGIKIFPNPTTINKVFVVSRGIKEYKIHNISGREIQAGKTINGEIILKEIPKGIYFLKIGEETKKLIIQ